MHPESHYQVTQLALSSYPSQSIAQRTHLSTERFGEAILLGTQREDAPSFTRICNWHFYPANPLLQTEPSKRFSLASLGLHLSSINIFNSRCQQLSQALHAVNPLMSLQIFGRILHHLQDMSTPSHVVPVYHGLFTKDPYEKFLRTHWDAIQREIKVRQLIQTPTAANNEDYLDLYHQAAQRMQQQLSHCDFGFPEPLNHSEQNVRSDLLWCSHQPQTKPRSLLSWQRFGFGHFGPLGQHYGETKRFEHDGCTYQVSQQSWLRLAASFVAHAVNDSLSALQLLQTQLMAMEENSLAKTDR